MKQFYLFIILIAAIFFTHNGNVNAQSSELDFSIQFQDSNIHDAFIYPNPVTDFRFKVKSNQIITTVEVHNLLGQIIHSEINDSYSSEDIYIDLMNCEKGMYLLKIVFDDDQYIIKKLLVK